jgi:hypothetical protein
VGMGIAHGYAHVNVGMPPADAMGSN